MRWHDVLPIAISVLVILLVAILERHSRVAAALTATMPLTAPLALWIVYNSARGEPAAVSQFSLGLLLGILPTVAFLTVVWIGSRQGLRLLPLLLLGYSTWAIAAAGLFGLRKLLGF
jgi:hypothetical protein